ncbi:MAG: cupin domain-containing protein [Woeseiaceae bacterium]
MSKLIIRLNPDPDGFGNTPDELEAADFSSDVPLQHSHSVYENDDIGLYVGVWDTDAMLEVGGPYACDEFMWLLEGECHIKNNATGEVEVVNAGTPFVIPKGYDCQWQQPGYLRKYYVISEHPSEEIPAAPAHEGIVVPQENISYQDVTGRFYSGMRTLDANVSERQAYPHNEFACIKDGSITLTDEHGASQEFVAGDAYFIPQGVVCSVAVEKSVSMYIAVIQPG